jgi:hypothetical protein
VLRLYEEPWFTFRFADDRRGGRFHLVGVPPGQAIAVFRLTASGRGELLRRAVVGAGGWVDLSDPIVVRAGEGFVAEPGDVK